MEMKYREGEVLTFQNYIDVVKHQYWHDFIDENQHQDDIKCPEKGLFSLSVIIFYIYQTYCCYLNHNENVLREDRYHLFCLMLDSKTLIQLDFQGNLFLFRLNESPMEYKKEKIMKITRDSTIQDIDQVISHELFDLDFDSKPWRQYINRLSRQSRDLLMSRQNYVYCSHMWEECSVEKDTRENQVSLLLMNNLWIYYLLQPFLFAINDLFWRLVDCVTPYQIITQYSFLCGYDLNLYGDHEHMEFYHDLSLEESKEVLKIYGNFHDIRLELGQALIYEKGNLIINIFRLFFS